MTMTEHEARTGDKTMHGEVPDWRIDNSTDSPILVYQNCSVIQDEQAAYVLRLIAADQSPTPEAERPALVGGEDGLRDALRAYLKAQRRMLDKWGDGDANVRGDLWRDLHACEDAAEAALSLPAAQDGVMRAVGADERAWAMIELAQVNGAVADEGENGKFWTLDLAAWKALDEALHHIYTQLHATPNAIRGDKGAEAVSDRVMLSRVLVDLNMSSWECPECGHSEDCATMDVAHMIRSHLGVAPTQAAAKDTP